MRDLADRTFEDPTEVSRREKYYHGLLIEIGALLWSSDAFDKHGERLFISLPKIAKSLRDNEKDLIKAIRKHRDMKADDRCWMDDQQLYAALKDGNTGDNHIGDPEAMLANCQRYVSVRCAVGHWTSYTELEEECKRLRTALKNAEERDPKQWCG